MVSLSDCADINFKLTSFVDCYKVCDIPIDLNDLKHLWKEETRQGGDGPHCMINFNLSVELEADITFSFLLAGKSLTVALIVDMNANSSYR
jgi:hypothetical protein